MRPAGWLGVEAARGKRFKFCFVELFPVADAPGAGDYGCYAVVAMGMRRNFRVRRYAKHNCVHTCVIRITFEYHSLNSSNSRTASARIPALWKLVLGRSKTLFAEVDCGNCYGRRGNLGRVEEIANK